jgi:hypothetical protein
LPGSNEIGQLLLRQPPAVDGNRLLVRSDKFLYCVGK